jgi:hypothetical protein
MTSDGYLDLLPGFAYLYNKYWGDRLPGVGDQVVVFGFREPEFFLPHNFSFVSLGDQKDYPFNKWSNALLKAMDKCPDDVFCLMLEDYWLVRPVDIEAVNILRRYMLQFQYVIKADLGADRLYAHMADCDYGMAGRLDLVKSTPGSPYHMSLWPGLWSAPNLRQILIPDESPHDLEIVGTQRLSRQPSLMVVGTRNYPMKISLARRQSDPSATSYDGLQPHDIEEMRQKGILGV